jgi:beta-galactosidase
VTGDQLSGPVIVRAKFNIAGAPTDTFLDMTGWSKGSIFVNGFNLGRYFHLGPQVTSYIPAPLLKQGENEVFFIVRKLIAFFNDLTLIAFLDYCL